MVTNYRHDRLIKERRQKIYGALFALALIFILGRGPIFSFLGRISHLIGIPFWKTSVTFSDTTDYLSEYAKPKSVVVNELLLLKQNSQNYNESKAIIETLTTENRNIKNLLGREIKDKKIIYHDTYSNDL